ncbi:MAG: ABC transporter permease subunit [Dehalococcoidia bacterium]
MTRVIFMLTLGQLVRQRRTLLLLLIAALPVGLALLFRLTVGEDGDEFATALLGHFVVALVLPLTALVIGTAALGQELEDGTFVYLIAKPLPRWKVVLAKIGAAWVVTGAVVGASVIASGLILLAGSDYGGLVVGFTVAVVVGALVYAALFVSLSIRFGRALIIGLVYVFVWEGLISQFIAGVRFLSARAYTMAVADAIADLPSTVFSGVLAPVPAAVLLTLVTLAAVAYAIRRLERYQMSERV